MNHTHLSKPLAIPGLNRKTGYVYIMASFSKAIYVGVTSNLTRRVQEHKGKVNECFTSRYNHHMLVYFEEHQLIVDAIAREKQIKRWRRSKKVALIELENPHWRDLFEGMQ